MTGDASLPQFKVTVIVVSFNTVDHLRRCLGALSDRHETIVVDNASSDGSADMVAHEFPHVHLIRNRANVGFGAANNQGLEAMSGDLALLLNSDARMTAQQVDQLSREFAESDVVAAGPGQIDERGHPIPCAANRLTLWAVFCEQTLLERLFPFWPFNSYWQSPRKKSPRDVEQVMGACLMFRPVARFDERFFLYCEDTELCYRLRKVGRIRYIPEIEIEHTLGASSRQDRWRSVARYNRGKELFFLIHGSRMAAAAVWLMNRLGALLRLVIWLLLTLVTLFAVGRVRRQVGLFWKVLTTPGSGPARPHGTPEEL